MEIWICPNMGTEDMLRLFEEPTAWAKARPLVSTYQMYVQLITCDRESDPNGADWCGPNEHPRMLEGRVFERLREWNIKLAIEAGAVKGEDCEARGNTQNALKAIERIRAAGGELHSVAIDESLVSARADCHQPPEETARHVAAYIRRLREEGVVVGMLEAYPSNSMSQIIRYLDLLRAEDALPAFLHMDIDRLEIRNERISDATLKADFKALTSHCKSAGITLGYIVWGNNAWTDEEYTKDARELLKILRTVLPAPPDRLIVQSWQNRASRVNSPKPLLDVPKNLPDTGRPSLTAMAIEASNFWTSPSSAPTKKSFWERILEQLGKR